MERKCKRDNYIMLPEFSIFSLSSPTLLMCSDRKRSGSISSIAFPWIVENNNKISPQIYFLGLITPRFYLYTMCSRVLTVSVASVGHTLVYQYLSCTGEPKCGSRISGVASKVLHIGPDSPWTSLNLLAALANTVQYEVSFLH